ncbi:MAG TPA: SapC family protein [Cellvibrionaceae bacterium]
MTNYVMLNNVQHFNLKVTDRYSASVGDNNAAAIVFPTEFAEIQREYPIVFSKHLESNQYQAVALLGIQKDENLFLQENAVNANGWRGNYVPAIIARGPFIISMPEQDDDASAPLIFIDIDSSKVNESAGEPLFLPLGGSSPYLERVAKILGVIQQGKEVSESMYALFDELGLFEPLTVNIELNNGGKFRLENYYTISESKLGSLDGKALERLNKSGYLQGAFLIVASLSNIQKLIDIKNSQS